MSKAEILDYFDDINHAYNDCGKKDSLSYMLDELDTEIRAKAIDEFAERIKQGDVIEYMGSYVSYEAIASFIDEIAEKMKGGAE